MGLPAADASGAGDGRWRDSPWVLKERPVDSPMARTRGVRGPGVGDNSGQREQTQLRTRRGTKTVFSALGTE